MMMTGWGWFRVGALGVWLLSPSPQAFAARVETIDLTGVGPAIVISGPIEAGDADSFHRVAARLGHATVITTGPGGRVAEAIAIGDETRARGWTTLVPQGAACASACSLIWLAGTHRLLAPGARIGFHALSLWQDGQLQETHDADFLLRRWLTALGYELDATATIVNTQAASMRWFDAIELQANGIESEPFP